LILVHIGENGNHGRSCVKITLDFSTQRREWAIGHHRKAMKLTLLLFLAYIQYERMRIIEDHELKIT